MQASSEAASAEFDPLKLFDHLDLLDYYELLGVDPRVDYLRIRDAYYERSIRCHPDRYAGDERARERQHANEVFKRLNEAFSVLGDPLLRPQYDVGRTSGQTRLHAEVRASNATRVRELSHPFARAYLHSARRKFESGRLQEALQDVLLGQSCKDVRSLQDLHRSITIAMGASAQYSAPF